MGNGMGFLQIISDDSSNGNQGTACRIHGSIPIHKVSGIIHIGLGKSVSFGGGAHAHFAGFGAQEGNFSHRIEKLNFGRPVTGLITPLVGSEQISNSNADLYNYYINIVPTKIFHRGMFSQSTITYQYAVTYRKRTVDHASGSHGMPGITIKYEFSSLVIEVRDGDRSLISLLLRLCAVVGGVFATSTILNGIFNLLVSWYYDGKTRKQSELKQPLVNGLPSAKNHHLPYSVPVEI